ncbi:hypothetical protein Ciccas_010055 [Cichlidogyrus casuarinus]|uniref:Uncharacterized protein n=1 Tax=Cichlidogyrus casuarinus TaxID=1844966 RepID=A0ABD2PVS3_9PLAT
MAIEEWSSKNCLGNITLGRKSNPSVRVVQAQMKQVRRTNPGVSCCSTNMLIAAALLHRITTL